jgi:hypothetical protein
VSRPESLGNRPHFDYGPRARANRLVRRPERGQCKSPACNVDERTGGWPRSSAVRRDSQNRAPSLTFLSNRKSVYKSCLWDQTRCEELDFLLCRNPRCTTAWKIRLSFLKLLYTARFNQTQQSFERLEHSATLGPDRRKRGAKPPDLTDAIACPHGHDGLPDAPLTIALQSPI